ncbi:MAG: IS200/IS605 family transposase [Bacteroidota bacterium]
MSHSLRELFYHLVWSTKYHEPIITANIKPVVLQLLKTKASDLGCRVYALNCVSDHVHLLLYIPPNLAVSKVINGLKGASSHELKGLSTSFCWQEGYGIFTLRRSDLPVVESYIKNQERHHRENSFDPMWEPTPSCISPAQG